MSLAAQSGQTAMWAWKRPSVEQITAVLQQVTDGVPVGKVCRRVGFSEQASSRWKKTHGGVPASEARELKQLRDGDGKPKRLVAGLSPHPHVRVRPRSARRSRRQSYPAHAERPASVSA